jgi:hypothetical protein
MNLRYLLLNQEGEIVSHADHCDDWSWVEANERDHPETFTIVECEMKVRNQRTFGPYRVGEDPRFDRELCNHEQMPETVDTPARKIRTGDWVWTGDRFWQVDEVEYTELPEDYEVTVYMNHVGRPVEPSHVYAVATDPHWAADWQGRRNQ